MRKVTWLDLYKEMGFGADLLLLLFLAILVYGCVIHFRKKGHAWRTSFLLLCSVQAVAGIAGALLLSLKLAYYNLRSCSGSGDPRNLLYGVAELSGIIPFAAWLTIILLVCSTVLFLTEKRSAPDDPAGRGEF